MIGDLKGFVEREKAIIGLFVHWPNRLETCSKNRPLPGFTTRNDAVPKKWKEKPGGFTPETQMFQR